MQHIATCLTHREVESLIPSGAWLAQVEKGVSERKKVARANMLIHVRLVKLSEDAQQSLTGERSIASADRKPPALVDDEMTFADDEEACWIGL